jgi:hypothetical protein
MSRPTTIRHKLAAVAAAAAVAFAGAAVARRPPDAAADLATRPADLERAQPVATGTSVAPPLTRSTAVRSLPSAAGLVAAASREELAAHRRLLAGRLASELRGVGAERIERAMSAADAELRSALRSGGRPRSLATMLRLSEQELDAAFEAVAVHSAADVRGGGRPV